MDPITLRVCSYNIHKGVCASNVRPILPQLRHSIRTINADLMFLQEVVGEKKRFASGEIDEQEYENRKKILAEDESSTQ